MTLGKLLFAIVAVGAAALGSKHMLKEKKVAVYEGKRKRYMEASGGSYRLPSCCTSHLDEITSDTLKRCVGGITVSMTDLGGASNTAAKPNPVSTHKLVTTDWKQKGKDHAKIAETVSTSSIDSMFYMAEAHFSKHANEKNTDAYKFWHGFINHLNHLRESSDSSHKHIKPLYSPDDE